MCVSSDPNRPAAMGCSGSRDARARRDIEMAATVRRQSHRRSASSLGTFGGLRRVQHDGVLAASLLPLEEMVKGGAAGSPGEEALVWSVEGPRRASWELMTRRLPGGKMGLLEVLDAASATSGTVRWSAPATSSGDSSSVVSVSEFDPAVLSRSLPRQTLVEPSPSQHPVVLLPEDPLVEMMTPVSRLDIPEVTGLVRARVDEFHEKMKAKKKLKEQGGGESSDAVSVEVTEPPRRGAAVVYFTSLRGVRRTFEDGRAVRSILRCYRVRVDERDVSMHAAFKDELRALLGATAGLPRVFVPGDGGTTVADLGSADDVRALHEAGELATALAWCEPLAAEAYLAPPCPGCGDMGFLPCKTCYGSCKLFAGEEFIHFVGVFQRCPDCNENGLIRCPACCY